MLIFTQQALSSHAAEHLFHQHDQSCEIFIALEHSKNALIVDALVFALAQKITITFCFIDLQNYFHAIQSIARSPPDHSLRIS